nr:MAG TPA: hypothetical protein [Microviridae sp.]
MKEIIKIAIGITLSVIAVMAFLVAIGLISRLATS